MGRYSEAAGSGPEMVTATKIAAFVYCAEAWRLEHGLGLEAGNQGMREAGKRHHEQKATTEHMAGAARGLGRLLVVVAVLVLLALLWWVWK